MKFIIALFVLLSTSAYSLTEQESIKSIISENIKNPHYQVGVAFLTGEKLEVDHNKALFWLAQSSEIENYDKADYLIAEMYSKGLTKSKEKNIKIATFFYKRAAESGNIDAIIKLSTLYIFEEEVQNYEDGFFWLEKANERDNSTASLLFYLLSIDEKDITSIKKQIPFLEMQSKKGDKYSSFSLGYLHLIGIAVEKDIDKSREYFAKALNNGLIVSSIFLNKIDKIISKK